MILLDLVESRAAVEVSKRVETVLRLNQRFQLPSTPPVPADLTAVLEPNAKVRAGPKSRPTIAEPHASERVRLAALELSRPVVLRPPPEPSFGPASGSALRSTRNAHFMPLSVLSLALK